MDFIRLKYEQLCSTHSDINEHLPTLFRYANECESIIEMGVRSCVSSWAFAWGLLNNNKSRRNLLLNDIVECEIKDLLYYGSGYDLNLNIKYKWINNLSLDVAEDVDMVFIDTWHIYGQLKRELDKFSKITKKYIIMHDTTIDEIYGETIRSGWNADIQSESSGFPVSEINCGLGKAINEFLSTNKDWKLHEKYTNNNGLTVLKRVNPN